MLIKFGIHWYSRVFIVFFEFCGGIHAGYIRRLSRGICVRYLEYPRVF